MTQAQIEAYLALLVACERALSDMLKPQHETEPEIIIPLLQAAIAQAHRADEEATRQEHITMLRACGLVR
jgi:hypothetical protein